MTNLLRRVFRTCVIVGLPLLCHCDDRVMVHIRVTGAPSTVRTLRVFAELNGKPALSADEFQDPLQEVNLVLPRSALGEGKLFVSIIGLGGWCKTQLRERGEYGLGEGGDARKSLGWCWILRNAECRRILRGFWGLLGAASG